MFTIEKLIQHFKNDVNITNILGEGNNCRIYMLVAPINFQTPFVTITTIGENYFYSYEDEIDLYKVRIQINCYDKNYLVVKNLSDKIKNSLKNFENEINGVFVINEFDTFDVETKNYGIILEFYLWDKK